jgi:thioredoxin reductase
MELFDVVIIGGGPAGLSAALTLGRARQRVLVVDAGEPRNAPSHAAHGFLSRDGMDPAELRQIARDQLQPYESVIVRNGEVTQAEGSDGAFTLRIDDRDDVHARKVIIAAGVRDLLPDIEGARDLFGRSVFLCPYCDGWEVRDKRLAVLGPPEMAEEFAGLIRNWSRDLVVLLNGAELDAESRANLDRLGVAVRDEPIARFEGEGSLERIVFESGDPLERDAIFLRSPEAPRSRLADALGCELEMEGHIPGLIAVDDIQQTTVPGVFAAGDVTTPMQQIWKAAATGHMAAAAAHHALVRENIEQELKATVV